MVENAQNINCIFGWVSNKERWKQFGEADLLVLPYLQAQYQSGPLHNAVSAGIPVVVTRTGALYEMVENFKFGEIVEKNPRKDITNLYLCPLATKAQALGFTIYYLTECKEKEVSMIYPICHSHSRETSKGVSRIWKYVVELPKD